MISWQRCSNYITILLLLIFLGCSKKNNKEYEKLISEVKFPEVEHDFGILEEGKEAKYAFEFLNIGSNPLIIKEVRTSCGCTVPSYNTKPIKPGEKGKIIVKYDTKRIGKFYKTIIVFLNAKNSPITLIIKGEVIPSQKEAAAKK